MCLSFSVVFFFFFKQKTAYEMRISDWSSDVCSSDLAEWAAFEAANAGKIILPADSYQTVLAVRDAVHRHPVAGPLLRGGKAEQSFYADDPETGALIKCRLDWMPDSGEFILNVKTTDDASPEVFAKKVAHIRSHTQQPWAHT